MHIIMGVFLDRCAFLYACNVRWKILHRHYWRMRIKCVRLNQFAFESMYSGDTELCIRHWWCVNKIFSFLFLSKWTFRGCLKGKKIIWVLLLLLCHEFCVFTSNVIVDYAIARLLQCPENAEAGNISLIEFFTSKVASRLNWRLSVSKFHQ